MLLNGPIDDNDNDNDDGDDNHNDMMIMMMTMIMTYVCNLQTWLVICSRQLEKTQQNAWKSGFKIFTHI